MTKKNSIQNQQQRICILVRYNSIYSEIINQILKEVRIEDYIFTNKINIVHWEKEPHKRKISPQKSIGLIITTDNCSFKKFADLFEQRVAKEPKLSNKIKYFALPVSKEV